jgi:hypothetical protein
MPADGGPDGPGREAGTDADATGQDALAPRPDTPVPPPDAPRCGGERTQVGSTQVVPSLMLVLDQSGSMSERDFGGGPRLLALQQAAIQLINSPELDGKVTWGMTAFPAASALRTCVSSCAAQDQQACIDVCTGSSDGSCLSTCQTCNSDCTQRYPSQGCEVFLDQPDVPLQSSTNDQVIAAIRNMTPGGDTPTDSVMKAMLQYLPGLFNAEHPAYVVLGTDGAPHCATGTPDGTLRDAFAAVMQLRVLGVKTFVIGLAQGPGSEGHDALNQLATAGGTARDGDTFYYPASDPQMLAMDLADIATTIKAGCKMALDRPLPTGRAVYVSINGMPLENDPDNGYSYDNENGTTYVILNGTACAMAAAGDVVQVDFGCPPNG